jgi:hypothetical protein
MASYLVNDAHRVASLGLPIDGAAQRVCGGFEEGEGNR